MATPIYDLLGASLALLQDSIRGRAKEYAVYTLQWFPMNASAVRQKASFTVDANADFVGIIPVWYATDTAAPPAEILAPMVTFNWQITGGRLMFDKDARLKDVCGQQVTNGFPFAFPLWIPRTATLNGFLSDLAATARNIEIAIHGYHIYDRSAGDNKAGGF